MARKRDLLGLTPHWHVDCRLEHELPDDRIVSRRFLIQVGFGSVALASMLLAGWIGYTRFSLVREISDWESQIEERREQLDEIQRNQLDYRNEAAKIDEATQKVGSSILISGFISELGHELPAAITIDGIEWYGEELVVQGVVPSAISYKSYLSFLHSEDSAMWGKFEVREISYERASRTQDIYQFELGFRPITQQ